MIPGLALALLAVGAGFLVHQSVPAVPQLTVCVVLGVIAGQIPAVVRRLDGPFKPGIATAARRCLRIGVVLLGLQLVLTDVVRLGWSTVLTVLGVTAVAFAGTYLIGRAARLPGREPLLLAAGFAICGASAVGAMAAVTRSDPKEQSRPIALVTLCGTLAIVVLPVIASALHFSPDRFGRWTGASVHDVGQVVATAQQWGGTALAVAILVKLLRVLLLAPLVAGTGLVLRLRGAAEGARAPILPLFVAGFVVAVLLRSLLPLPQPVLDAAQLLQTVLLGMALFGLGSGIRFRQLVPNGTAATSLRDAPEPAYRGPGTGLATAAAGLGAWVLIAVAALAVTVA